MKSVAQQTATAHVSDLTRLLGLERSLLEYLLYKLVSARLLMSGSESRYIMQALVEVEDAVDRVRAIAVRREALVRAIAAELDIEPTGLTLDRIADVADATNRYILYELRHDYVRLVYQIDNAARDNRSLADLSLSATTELLKSFAGTPTGMTYDEGGGTHHIRPNPVAVDEVM